MCIHVSDIYSTHNLGKPNPEYGGQRRKKMSTSKQLLPRAQKFCLPGKLERDNIGRQERDGHGSIAVFTYVLKWVYCKTLGQNAH